MAFKDRFEKLVSYFDTDDVNEMEALDNSAGRQVPSQPVTRPATSRPQATYPERSQTNRQRPAEATAQPSSRTSVPPSRQAVSRSQASSSYQQVTGTAQARPVPPARDDLPRQQEPARPTQTTVATSQGPMRIALKYPKAYEDAPAIVDLLLKNECVLIDFEYMLDAQARRCLDFLDGASKVLYGSLQKVGTNMFLLAPANVVVDLDDLTSPSQETESSQYNYDMRRR